jgi:hypothetical protein
MPDRWIDQHVGDESRPRPGFEDALAGDLHREWTGAARRAWLRMGLAAAAVVALTVGSVLWFGRSDDHVITVDTTPTTAPVIDTTVDSVVETVAPSSTTPAVAPVAYAVGDSVMLGAADLLAEQGVMVDAQENRGVEGTVDAIRSLADAGSLGPGTALVVQVGTNSAISGADLEFILDSVPAETLVLFMTVHAPVEWAAGNNELIRTLVPTARAEAKVIDWDATAVDEELCPDGIHVSCNPRATDRYAGLVMSSIAQARAESTLLEIPAEPVKRYVVRLADGDYLGAAQLLGEGGLEPEARADLRPLFDPEFGLVPGAVTTDALAVALERWCAQAICVSPSDLQVIDGFNRAAVTYEIDGVERTSTYVGSSFEGQPMVQGLPLQLLVGGDLAATVECPVTGGFERGLQTWADLDGDGWWELLVAQMIASADDESGVVTYRITACGTTTKVEPLEVTGDGLAIYPLNPMRSGPDTLLIGFLEGYANGTMYQFDGSRLTQLPGTRWDMGPPVTGMEQMSVGCADLLGDRNVAIVNYTFVEADGQLRYTARSAIVEGATVDGQLDSNSDGAARIRIGYCHDLPVRTD